MRHGRGEARGGPATGAGCPGVAAGHALRQTERMQDCCEITADYSDRQRRVLRIVLAINLAMFVAESTAGLLATLALSANVVCLALLWPRRRDDVNMRSAFNVLRDARRHLQPVRVG